MCRIFGSFGKKLISENTLRAISSSQLKGGPDAQYICHGIDWTLGNNRLAIQGLTDGIQPFTLNKIHAVYNGEIYNHVELKKNLAAQGYLLNNQCDGSVIIPLYEIYGENFVKYLDGMFAIAIIDERTERKLILCSDPSSVKSIYYHWDNLTDTLYFSSELKPLFSFPVSKKIRMEAVDEYLIGRSIWHNNTFFENVYSLGPGMLLTKIANNSPRIYEYETNIYTRWDGSSFEETASIFNQLLDKEISQMLKSDVPVCAVTSGGLDSSYLTALATRKTSNLHCFNIAYEGNWPADERSFAQEVAVKFGANYHQVIIKEHEFPEIIKKTIEHLGDPNSAPHALSTYALYKAVNQAGFKVAIAGEGADEFFSGYERFREAVFDSDEGWLDRYFDKMCATLAKMRDFVYHGDYKNFLAKHEFSLLSHAKNKIILNEKKLNSRLKSLLHFDQNERFTSYILRRTDHLSMANSVEVRVPFCQPGIVNFSKSLPDHYLIDKKSVKRILYAAARTLLPESILNRPKQPFTLPITAMLKKGFVLFDILQSTLTSQVFKSRGLFNQKNINDLMERQINHPDAHTANMLWSIMILELWLQAYDSSLNFKLLQEAIYE